VGRRLARSKSKAACGLLYDYESAWRWALSLTVEERAARFSEIKRSNGR
jgi:hypothetical protein